MTEKNPEDSGESRKKEVVNGVLTSGKLKGRPFTIFFDKDPTKTQLVVNGNVVPYTKLSITSNRSEAVAKIEIEGWFIPEES